MNVVGIWDGHNAGAALLQQGRVRFAVNEERLSRRKLEICFPIRSIKKCLAFAGLTRRWGDGGRAARNATTPFAAAKPLPVRSRVSLDS